MNHGTNRLENDADNNGGSQDSEYLPVTLTAENAVDSVLHLSPEQRVMGGEADISKGGITLRIGYRPQARNLRLLYEKSGRQLPPDLDVYHAYDLWLLTHSVGIVDDDFARTVRQFGYKVWFPDDLNDGKRITVVKVLPETRFIEHINGKFETRADLEASGNAEVPKQMSDLLGQIVGLSADAKISLSTQANLVGRISFEVLTNAVNAVGENDMYSEWLFHRVERPLIGMQVMMQVLRTPRRMRRLSFRAQVYASIGVWGLQASKLASDLVQLEAELS